MYALATTESVTVPTLPWCGWMMKSSVTWVMSFDCPFEAK